MIAEIAQFLRSNPGTKGKEIARQLGLEKGAVNSLLYKNPKTFAHDDEHCWSLTAPNKLTVILEEEAWVRATSFEDVLAVTGSPLDEPVSEVEFVVPKGCKIMIDAAARILALCNQTVMLGKTVSIDFSACMATLTYFNRLGFFDHLAETVNVVPERPSQSGAVTHRGKNDGVVELASIDHRNPDESIPKRLKNSLVNCAGERYSQSAFTFISELFGNVRDHAKSEIPGFAALQHYPRGGKIQVVISDSGVGIVGSLQPVLEHKYQELFRRIDFSKPEAGAELVLHVFKQGRVSSASEDGRGLGLKRSGDVAANFNATVTVRQKNFELTMVYSDGRLNRSYPRLNMPTILGTHICFDFLIDS
ncbi:TPA: ATP-binding protein [Pseudomonas aeruginosa]|uniref:ATP-binding protein n=1 Tax=Pseudomonas aeruginosa TaxID=287 RepID=UPI001CC1812E|nr:ATP-binding protein [Pseudomonas aeruginosa]HBO2993428.1 ATP-binding protein [Pseudomonas aeruginosa]HBO5656580.1 ATP-binding protein [Pseudomonas aeruginosa]HCI1863543.1 ATP-binding protein [Pseudomonas aeruginosa]HCI2647569.1 ATP-binding protein [Pseudomonas aeruginosa]